MHDKIAKLELAYGRGKGAVGVGGAVTRVESLNSSPAVPRPFSRGLS